ncbi:DUF11 domain-containing protein [Kineobactrum salinum]|uniref:DUF11 domain-containing protein n=1 Tax=Kineobactrum salinum TaxID=2708301 RepID=A0A6C0U9E0_9GAMM|nr:DUF11 domain-containing protein [Kineobactrum salinum]QIB66264.1 DUF11 domain-containing protein [Kineobactrum salinum]
MTIDGHNLAPDLRGRDGRAATMRRRHRRGAGWNWALLLAVSAVFASAAQANADLVLNHTVDKATASATEEVTYTLRVTNNGPETSNGIELVDTLPATTSYVGHTTDQGSCSHSGAPTGGTLTCTLGTLTNSAEAIVELVAVVASSSPSTIVNNATVSAATADPDLNNNQVLRNVTVTSGTDLQMILTGSADPVLSGGALSYSASVANNGPDAATNLTATITLAPASAARMRCPPVASRRVRP